MIKTSVLSSSYTGLMMNQSVFLAIACNLFKMWEKPQAQGAIGFGFASRWLKNLFEIFQPITKCRNGDCIITLDSHFKTAVIHIS